MKTRKVTAVILTLILMVCSIGGCGFFEEAESQTPIAQVGGEANLSEAAGLRITVDKETGEMKIERPKKEEVPLSDNGDWTILVYMCGSDLESDSAAGTLDFEEMSSATASDKVRFVVETGGAQAWQNDYVNAGQIGRYLVENNEITLLEEQPGASMGDSKTLASFLKWAVEAYPAEHMGLVLWNHGSGSINGVCFDELFEDDALTLRDLDCALYSVYEGMSDRFEFVGFDACLMGTVETANILATYARYMVGSQESEPGKGWDYTSIGNYLASNPEANGADLGKVICDGFYDACVAEGEEEIATLSVIDLDKVDTFLQKFNAFAKEMYSVSENTATLSEMIRQIEGADNFGGNNRSEGYTNMVDLGGLMEACGSYANSSDALAALKDAVIYNKTGSQHQGCSGLSLYYPLSVEGSKELTVFENVCISPFYASFVDRQDFSSAIYYNPDEQEGYGETYYDEENGCYYFIEDGVEYCYDESDGTYWYYDEDSDEWLEVEGDCEYDYSNYDYDDSNDDFGYDDSYWFSDDGNWEYGSDYTWDENSESYEANIEQNDHWNYADQYESTGESRYITFLKEPGIDKNGKFGFTLDARGISRASSVYGYVYQYYEDEGVYYELGETIDVVGDWESGHFEDNFDGYWLSLPDGQNLSLTVVDCSDDYVIYSSPILLNDKETNLRIKQNLSDQSITVEGAWDGISSTGASAKSIQKIVSGDVIVPLYYGFTDSDEDDAEDTLYSGTEYKVSGTFTVEYGILDPADYFYAFEINDIYNDYYMSDFVGFGVDENGDVWYYEE